MNNDETHSQLRPTENKVTLKERMLGPQKLKTEHPVRSIFPKKNKKVYRKHRLRQFFSTGSAVPESQTISARRKRNRYQDS